MVYIFVFLSSLTAVYSQTVEVTATTDSKEVQAILKKERDESRANRAYFDEQDRCRSFIRARNLAKAETSCKLAVSLVEKLPKEHVLERSSARGSLAIALLWRQKPEEAILLLNKALEVGRPVIDDSDAETGDIYFLLGQAYHFLRDVQNARSHYEKAESIYRTAFIEIDDDKIRVPYGGMIKNIVETHYLLLKSAGLDGEADKLQLRLAEVEREFSKYLVN